MDTKFSSAIHTLILIDQATEPMTSDQIAISVGTNASYIRKLTALMKKAGLIESRRGVAGFALAKPASQMTFLEIYKAVMEVDALHIFNLHQNPNDECIVGHNIQPVLGSMFHKMEEEVERDLQAMTLEDCIHKMQDYIKSKEA